MYEDELWLLLHGLERLSSGGNYVTFPFCVPFAAADLQIIESSMYSYRVQDIEMKREKIK